MRTPCLNFINQPPLYDFFPKKMAPCITSFWISLSAFLATLFQIISKYLVKYPIDDCSEEKELCSPSDVQEHEEIVLDEEEEIPELEVIEYEETEYEGFEEKESDTPKFSFKFQFQPYEDTTTRTTGDLTASTSKYEFLTEKNCSGFVVEPKVVSFSVQELFFNSSEVSVDNKEIIDDGFLSEKDFLQPSLEKEGELEEIESNLYSGEYFEKPESVVLFDNPLFEKEEPVIDSNSPVEEFNNENQFVSGNSPEEEDFSDENQFVSEKELVSLDYEPESICLWDKFSVMVSMMDSNEDEFLSDGDFDSGVQPNVAVEFEDRKRASMEAIHNSGDFSRGAQPDVSVELEDRDTGSMEAIHNSERTHIEAFQDSEEIHLDSLEVSEEGTVEISSPGYANMSKEVEPAVMDEVLEMMDDVLELQRRNLPSLSNLETDPEIEREYYELRAQCKQENSDKIEADMDFNTDRVLEGEDVETNDYISVQKLNIHESTVFGEFLEMDDNTSKDVEVNFLTTSNLESDPDIEREYQEMEAKLEKEYSSKEGTKELDNLGEPTIMKDASLSDKEESDSLEALWEHQEMIEQLKMELRKVRAIGLPTIYEESESPRLTEDLRPWKIDANFVHEDQINEHHQFYKGYRERMRKLDILNYQKMYAMGFYLQLKDPVKPISTNKSTAPIGAPVLPHNFFSSKNRKPEANSSMKFMMEVESELELVYVGQMCLSWEFLHWQYGKAKELVLSDKYETRAYNQVAGEFQQFQVLVQRFIEKEAFEGPRVPTYIKSRCDLRNLLEVPVIKEDSKDKVGRERSKADITCSMLLEIMEESMRLFWEFVRADKHDSGILLKKGFSEPQGKLLNKADTELWVDIQRDLQKKKKKLKEIVRSGNCIVKKFQKNHKEEPDQLLFFSQIDLKLVARVLRMSRITSDQLGWCHEKLRRISFANRKIHVEPSFLLFPC